MQSIRPQFKPYLISSSPFSSFLKEDMFSVQPTSLPGQTISQNQYVVADGVDALSQDSSLTKYTKCSIGSQSSFFEDYEQQNDLDEITEKSQGKKLKKELKKQKIKRKQTEQKQNGHSKIFKFKFHDISEDIQAFKISQCVNQTKNQKNPLKFQSLSNQIQKLTQNNFANSQSKKKIHLQNTSISVKSNFPYLCFLQLDELKVLKKKLREDSSKVQSFSDQTLFIKQEEQKTQNQNQIQNINYFVDDLIQEAKHKIQKKSSKKRSFRKLNFIQNMINLLENYQINIQNAKPKQSQIKKIQLSRRNCDNGKKTLLIDLDNTLIYTEKPQSLSQISLCSDTQHFIRQNDGKYRKLYIRPYARQFLQRISQNYEIMIFTAATKSYAQQIKNILDPKNRFISHILDRSHCYNPNKGNNGKMPYIKDLRRINRPLNKTILLDNSIFCFWYQVQNGIPITSYTKNEKNDQQLYKVASYLQILAQQDDIRIINKKYFKLQKYEQYVDSLTLVQEIYIQNYHG